MYAARLRTWLIKTRTNSDRKQRVRDMPRKAIKALYKRISTCKCREETLPYSVFA